MPIELQNLLPLERLYHLGVPQSLIDRVNEGDDWTSIILMSGILEICLTEAICSSFAMSEPLKVVQRLPLNGRIGKTTLAHELTLISDAERKFLTNFTEIRNSVAHGVSNFDFSFRKRFEEPKESKKFRECLILETAYDHCSEQDIDFDQDPRSVIFANVINTCLGAMAAAVFDEGTLDPDD